MTTHRPATANLRLLSVEDHPVNQLVLTELLAELNFAVDQANNGRTALQLASNLHYDLVFMDIQMPVMGGIEATARLRHLPGYAHTPIVAVSASPLADSSGSLGDMGFNDWLEKPYEMRALMAMLKKWLGDDRCHLRTATPDITASTATLSALDAKAVENLKQAFSGEESTELENFIRTAIQSCDDLCRQLQTALEAQDRSSVNRLAHGLKSISGNMGALRLMAISGELESLSKTGSNLQVISAGADHTAEYRRARMALLAVIDDLKSAQS